MNPKLKSVLLTLVPLAASTFTVSAAVLVVDPVADTVIRNTGVDDNVNFGTAGFLSVATVDISNIQRTLIQFDVSSIPVGSTIDSATLSLTADSSLFNLGNPTGVSMDVFRVYVPWVEDQATWQQSATGVSWAPGGNGGAHVGVGAAAPPSSPYGTDSTTVPNGYGTVVINWDITGLVDEWVNDVEEGNNGLLLRSSAPNQLHFRSSENVNGGGPSLSVTWTPIPEPMHLAVASSLGLLGFAGYRRYQSAHRG